MTTFLIDKYCSVLCLNFVSRLLIISEFEVAWNCFFILRRLIRLIVIYAWRCSFCDLYIFNLFEKIVCRQVFRKLGILIKKKYPNYLRPHVKNNGDIKVSSSIFIRNINSNGCLIEGADVSLNYSSLYESKWIQRSILCLYTLWCM